MSKGERPMSAAGGAEPADDPAPPPPPRRPSVMDTVDVLGVHVSVADMDALLGAMRTAVIERRQLTITFANPNYVMAAQRDSRLRGLMNAFDVNLADGWGIVLAARIFGKPLPTRMANDDITDGIFGLPAREDWRVFLFGSAPGVAERAAKNLAGWYPGLNVVGTEHGYWDVERGHPGRFDPEDVDRIVADINAAGPDILHVGVPTPLQQVFVTENRERLDVPVIITGGSYLDHLAERRHWFPPWVIKLRIGWLYRLFREPRRLWYRYTVELADYLFRVVRYRLRNGRQR
jgi:N-acetylglucosaminyldiphosphoundecaprenol N-acetyl-beta-D-mannosaminyltransferase